MFKWPDQCVSGLSLVLVIDPWFFLLVFIHLSDYTFGEQRELPFLEKDAIILGLCNRCYKLRSYNFHNIRYETKIHF